MKKRLRPVTAWAVVWEESGEVDDDDQHLLLFSTHFAATLALRSSLNPQYRSVAKVRVSEVMKLKRGKGPLKHKRLFCCHRTFKCGH